MIEVFLAELAKLIVGARKNCTWLELHHAGMVTETLSERPRLGDMGGDKTLSECHNMD